MNALLINYEKNIIIQKWSTSFKYKIDIFNGMSRTEANSMNYGLTRIAGIYSDKKGKHFTLFAFDIF